MASAIGHAAGSHSHCTAAEKIEKTITQIMILFPTSAVHPTLLQRWWKWFTFLFRHVKLSSLIRTFLGPTFFFSSSEYPPGRCLSTIDLLLIWKIFVHSFHDWEITWACIISWLFFFFWGRWWIGKHVVAHTCPTVAHPSSCYLGSNLIT